MARWKCSRSLRQGFLAACCAALLLFSLRPRLFRYTATFWGVFDSVITLTASVPTREEFDWYLDLAVDSFTGFHSIYDRFSESETIVNLYSVNHAAGGEPLAVEEPLFSLLLYAQEGERRTLGTVSPTFGAVTELWRRAIVSGNRLIPDEETLREAAGHAAPELLVLEKGAGRVRLTDPKALLDLGAVAKGYATERTARKLTAAGLSRFAISSGGNLCCGHPPDGKPMWEIGVQSPDRAVLSRAPSLASLRIPSGAVSTSGDYQRFFWYEQGGKRRRAHHIIDPATLHPGERCRSVTVACSSAADADLFSTALFLLDQKTGEMLAERENLAVLWVLPDGEMRANDAMRRLMKSGPPD
ncbi:FAD:protein FMN transferase [Yanshouia hominis]|uniref:FAD:protein FMN transferase n=1 Tax=Yanshouia hominis TaxID=2763673 RepID=A0ABR7NJR1_9FIRM|nr:FAD:protein FMN transferase [Yanshouia hominis]MBC8576615.1 FAD:protein FMN transferase [Yanshouia hominis]